MSSSPIVQDFPPIIDGEWYVFQLDVSSARNDFDTNKKPTLPIQCNTVIIIHNPIDNLQLAFNQKMFDSPFIVDVHKDDNVVIWKGKIEGIWIRHTNTNATEKVKIIYGNNIVYTHAHRHVFLDIENQPKWTRGTEQTAPAPNTNLVSVAAVAGSKVYIYGFEITAQEANDFLINWNDGSARQNRIVFNSAGTMLVVFSKAYNEGEGHTSGNITIQNVNAGAAGKKYFARLLTGAGD